MPPLPVWEFLSLFHGNEELSFDWPDHVTHGMCDIHWGTGMFCRTPVTNWRPPLKNGHPPSAALETPELKLQEWGDLDIPWGTIGLWTGSCRDRLRWRNSSMGAYQSTMKLRMKCTVTTLVSFLRCRNIWIWGESWCRSLTAWNWSCEMTPPWKPPGIIHLQLRPAPWGQLYPLLVVAQQLWHLHATTQLGVRRKVNNERGRGTNAPHWLTGWPRRWHTRLVVFYIWN